MKNKRAPQISKTKEIIKIQAEINKKEMKETIAKINNTESQVFKKTNKIDRSLAFRQTHQENKKKEDANQ